ncbi:MAG TPA: methionyl-tRNA formyltransferase [Saprospiraceae bacterium]|nr:methionyl-tRNA formyltransferase [Saprospiraceae bacterium]
MGLKIVFMGTPDFAVPSLEILLNQGGYSIVGVITATDKWGGRGGKTLIESPVKRFAQQHNLNILQPPNLKDPVFIKELKSLNADLQIVVAFRMLPEIVWNMPPLGTYNLHASLLPKYRGAAPIHWAVIHGEKETGLTTFKLQHEIDTGSILFQEAIPILSTDTTGDVHDRMMPIGAKLVLKTVEAIDSGNVFLLQQDETQVSKAPKLSKEMAKIEFEQDILTVYNFIRGMSPFPGSWTLLERKIFKIYFAEYEYFSETNSKKPGEITISQTDSMQIFCLDGIIKPIDVQLEGKKRMHINEFVNGYL